MPVKPLKGKREAGPAPRPASLRVLWRWGVAALTAATWVPTRFYLETGEVPPVAWGVSVFLAALCLLVGVGLFFARRTEYHTPVEARGGWADRVGSFWLASCGLGPFFGWALASAFTLTEGNWRWLYGGRVTLSVGLPVLTALPLLRYVSGRGAVLMLALLCGVTALPVWSAWASVLDLWDGPSTMRAWSPTPGAPESEYRHLPHTRRVLAGR